MKRFAVLSVNPETGNPGLMPFETLAEAQAHKYKAMRQGKLLVEIIDSPDQHEDWRRRAVVLINTLKMLVNSL